MSLQSRSVAQAVFNANGLPFNADYVVGTNPTTIGSNIFYQTYTYRSGGATGTILATANITYDGTGNAQTVTWSF
jgi:hypothetical protein